MPFDSDKRNRNGYLSRVDMAARNSSKESKAEQKKQNKEASTVLCSVVKDLGIKSGKQ